MKLKRLTLLLAAMCVESACHLENTGAAVTEAVTGNPRPWMKDRNNAAGKFFASKFDDSETQAYTGRTK